MRLNLVFNGVAALMLTASAQSLLAITIPAHGNVATVAGTGQAGPASSNIAATSATVNGPNGVAVDSSGNLYFADTNNNVIREISATTGVITTIVGTGAPCSPTGACGDGGPAINAQLNAPIGIAIDGSGNLFIADSGSQEVRMVTASTGVISTLVNSLPYMIGIAVDSRGNVYYSDEFTNSVYKLNLGTNVETTVAGSFDRGYSGDGGPGASAHLCSPQAIALDASGNLFISDVANNVIREVSAATGIITTVAGVDPQVSGTCGVGNVGAPTSGQSALQAEFSALAAVSIDQQGNLFVVDNTELYEVTAATGKINYLGGGGSSLASNIPATGAAMAPSFMTFDGSGNLYYAEPPYEDVRVIGGLGGPVQTAPVVLPAKGNIATLAGTGYDSYSGDKGLAVNADLNYPKGVFANTAQKFVYIGDTANNRVRMVDLSTGLITTIVGNGIAGESGDNGLATAAALNRPIGITEDYSGNLYVADSQNGAIRSITYSTNYASSYIGLLLSGYTHTSGVLADSSGDIYFSDPFSNSVYMMNGSNGSVSTAAGSFNQGYSGDNGPGTSAQLSSPQGLSGTVTGTEGYIADEGNSVIRQENTATGIITTYAGNGKVGYTGDGYAATAATLSNPTGVAVDGVGNVFIADTGNNVIREVNVSTGVITTVVGTGNPGSAGDGGPALNAELNAPADISFDPAGNLYIADTFNHKIRVVGGIGAAHSMPTITSVSPLSGVVGTKVVITGSSFGSAQGSVTIGGTVAPVTSWSATSITITVPSGATTGSLIVTAGGVPSNPVTFTVVAASISLSPSSGPVGTQVTITGSGFGATQGSSTVSFNGISASSNVVSWSATSIVVTVPAGATTGPVNVVVGQVTESGPIFTVLIDSAAIVYSYSIPSTGGYAANGNLLGYTDQVMGTWTFGSSTYNGTTGYDYTNRLLGGSASAGPYAGVSTCWTYDAFGNRITESVSTTACNQNPPLTTNTPVSTNNRLQTVTYDAAGNPLNDGANLYLYDAEGHVCAVQSSPVPGVTVIEAYIYDADGQRVEKGQVNTFSCNMATNGYKAEHAYALGQSGEQITEVDGSGHWLHTNVYAAGKLFASYDQNGNSLNFQLTDWVGTRRVQTNYAGAPEASFQSLPFGSRLISIPATDCTPDQDCYPADMTGTPLHFTGKQRDTESGLDYFGARYYSSTSGRFISPDWSTKEEAVPYAKLGDPQTLNLYAYVGNNPLTSIDIDGHRSLAAGSPQGCAGNGSVGCSPSEQEAFTPDANTKAQQNNSSSTPKPASPQGHFEYDQKTGQMTHVLPDGSRVAVGTGYSGQGNGLNNPSEQYTPNTGPIPQGSYTIEPQKDNVTGAGHKLPGSMRLDPTADNDTHGRAGFLIHGDNPRGDHSASNGCIILPRPARNAIGGSNDHILVVVP
jgi:RHS repeat-associated protein